MNMELNFKVGQHEALYIEMCSKAKQLQAMWQPKIGDKYIDMGDLWMIESGERLYYVTHHKENDIWLPTEENIQAILCAPTMEKPIDLLFRFTEWANGHRGITDDHRKFSIKCLWLCYMMFYLYEMVWMDNDFKKVV